MILRSKYLTANINPKSRYEPYVFTETGIYMLMTVLNGELATRQSKALIRTFKQMKDYLSHDPLLSDSSNIASLSLQILENTREISEIKETMVTKDAGNKITTISKADNKKLYYPMIEDLLLQPALRLR